MDSIAINLLQGIDTIIVRVSNIAASKKWYSEKLGMALLFEDDKMKLAVLDTKSPTSLTLWQTEKTVSVNRETASYPIFKTPNAGALKKELSNRGIEVGEIIQDDYVKYFFFYDPDGNILEACQLQE